MDKVIVPEISKVNLEPNDLLVFKLHESLTMEQRRVFEESIVEFLPNVRFFIIDGDDSIEVIHEMKRDA